MGRAFLHGQSGSGIKNAVDISDKVVWDTNNRFLIKDISEICTAVGHYGVGVTVTTPDTSIRAAFCVFFPWDGEVVPRAYAYDVRYYNSISQNTCSAVFDTDTGDLRVITSGSFTNSSAALFAAIMTPA